jgi:hypothetical protein
VYGFYNSLSIEGLFDFDAYSYVSVGVKQTLLAKRATLSLSVVDLFYQITFRVSTAILPVAFDNY